MKQATVKLPSGEYLIQEVPDATGDFIVRATKHCDNGSISWFNKWTNKETITLIPPGSWQLLGADPVNLTEEEAGEIVEKDSRMVSNGVDKRLVSGYKDYERFGSSSVFKVKKTPTASLDSLAASLGISKPYVILKNVEK